MPTLNQSLTLDPSFNSTYSKSANNATIPSQPGISSGTGDSSTAENLIFGIFATVVACLTLLIAYFQLRQGTVSRFAASVLHLGSSEQQDAGAVPDLDNEPEERDEGKDT